MTVIMSKKELGRISVLEQLKDKALTCRMADEKLGISMRQAFRCLQRYRKDGPTGLTHKRRGKQSTRRMDPATEARILELLRGKYEGFGPTFASEKLLTLDGISVSRECLRKTMLKHGLWQKQRKRRVGRTWRPRKEHIGQLVQLDGSFHAWMPRCGKKAMMISFVDDATSQILYAALYPNESTKSVMLATREYFLKHGKPYAIYSDRGSAYKVNTNNLNDDLYTQYERALSELGVGLIHAYSPQAKGRIERSFQILQDRLVKELKLAAINTIDEANAFIEDVFVPDYNNRFAVQPAHESNLHSPVARATLDDALCVVSERIVTNDWTIKYDHRRFQLDSSRPAIVKPKDHVIVHQKLSGEIYVTIRNENIMFDDITQKKCEKPARTIVERPHKPAKDHPWRRAILTPKSSLYISRP